MATTRTARAHSQASSFFDTDKDFRPAEFMHFCSQMLRKDKPIKEEKLRGKIERGAACMILFVLSSRCTIISNSDNDMD